MGGDDAARFRRGGRWLARTLSKIVEIQGKNVAGEGIQKVAAFMEIKPAMRTLFPLVVAAALLHFAPPAAAEIQKSDKPAAEKPVEGKEADGSSFEKAIPVKSVDAEYQWLRAKHPGHKVKRQALLANGGKHYDRISITTKDGKELEVYFDISSFFGKRGGGRGDLPLMVRVVSALGNNIK